MRRALPLAGLLGLVALPAEALAGTITVNTTTDDNTSSNTNISLREALAIANGSRAPTAIEMGTGLITAPVGTGQADTIQFAKLVFFADSGGGVPSTITVAGSDLPAIVDDGTTIAGDGRVRIAGGGARLCGLTILAQQNVVSGVWAEAFTRAGFCIDPAPAAARDASDNQLVDCRAYNNGTGGLGAVGAGVRIEGVHAKRNTVTGSTSGFPDTSAALFCQMGASGGNSNALQGVLIQNGASANVVSHCDLRGQQAGGGGAGVMIQLDAAGNTVGPSNVIADNDDGVIVISSSTETITHNVIGTEAADHGQDVGNQTSGVLLYNGGSGTTVSNNLVLYNGDFGIGVAEGVLRAVIDGNTVGGTTDVGGFAGGEGISLLTLAGAGTPPATITVQKNLVGFEKPGAGSPIPRANDGDGIRVRRNGTATVIDGNETADNTRAGIRLASRGEAVTVKNNDCHDNGEQGIRMLDGNGGTLSGGHQITANAVWSNKASGVTLIGPGGDASVFDGNIIGFTRAGVAAGNTFSGLIVSGADNVIVRNNSVGASPQAGLVIETGATGTKVNGNSIGFSGATAAGNTIAGILIQDGATGTVVAPAAAAMPGNVIKNNDEGILIQRGGGGAPTGSVIGPGNTVSGNTGPGVEVDGTGGGVQTHTITQSSITGNGTPGSGDGIVLSNGGNQAIPAPTIMTVSGTTAAATISGSISGGVSLPAKVELFTDASDQGQTYFATVTVAAGTAWSYSGAVPAGTNVTATVTSNLKNTSPFSTPVAAPPAPPPPDGGADVGLDAGTESPVVGTEAGAESTGTDAAAGSEVGADIGPDVVVGSDAAGSDAGAGSDAAGSDTGAGSDAGATADLPDDTLVTADGPDDTGPATDGPDDTGPATDGPDAGTGPGDASSADAGSSGDSAGPADDGGSGTDTGTMPDGSGQGDDGGGGGNTDAAKDGKPGANKSGGCDCTVGHDTSRAPVTLTMLGLAALTLRRRRWRKTRTRT